jgi:hypothetical protein
MMLAEMLDALDEREAEEFENMLAKRTTGRRS